MSLMFEHMECNCNSVLIYLSASDTTQYCVGSGSILVLDFSLHCGVYLPFVCPVIFYHIPDIVNFFGNIFLYFFTYF